MRKRVFNFDKPEYSHGFLLWQTTITWQRLIKNSLDRYDISHAQFVILAITFWHDFNKREISQKLIIRESKLDKMTVSKSLRKLVAQGYIKRAEHKHDTRAKTVYLTKTGKQLITKLIPLIEQIDQNFFAPLKRKEQESLLQTFSKLIINNNFSEQ